MREDLSKALQPAANEAVDPVAMARRDQQKALPKRFYTTASVEAVEGGFGVALDGRRTLTPGRKPLVSASRALAQAMADEWSAQGETIDPATMPLTRLFNSAIDGVAAQAEAVTDEIVRYAGSDLLCYRAGDPAALGAEQTRIWNPYLDWMREAFGARFTLAEGVMFAAQPDELASRVRGAVDATIGAGPDAPARLAALHTMTTLTGSAILALAVAQGFASGEDGWRAAHLDEDFQMGVWGADAQALARRARRWSDMAAAVRVFATR